MRNQYDWLYDEAILYYPFLTRGLVEWHPYKDDGFAIVFTYPDGSKKFYDSIIKAFRYFPPDKTSDLPVDEKEWRKEVGFNIHRSMLKYGVSQTELSIRSGISQSSISRYTDGVVTPSAYNLERIADVLGCDVKELTFIRRVDNI